MPLPYENACPKGFVSIRQASKILGVNYHTIEKLLEAGLIKGKTKKVVIEHVCVDRETLTPDLFVRTCEWCGKRFRPKQVINSRFCCTAHAAKHRYEERKKKQAAKKESTAGSKTQSKTKRKTPTRRKKA